MTSTPAKRGRKSIESWAAELQSLQEQEGLDKIMAELRKNPEKIMPCLNLVTGDVLLRQLKKPANPDRFPKTYTKLGCVPKAFMKQCIQSVDARFSNVIIDVMEKHDRGIVARLFHFSMASLANYGLPVCMHDKDTFELIFQKWSAKNAPPESSSRLFKVTWSHAPGDTLGAVNWAECGVYKLLPVDAVKKTAIQHISGVEAWRL